MLSKNSKNRTERLPRLSKTFSMIQLLIMVCLSSGYAQISCVQVVNVSLDSNCVSLVTPDELLSDMRSGITYDVMLTDRGGQVVSGDSLTLDHIGHTVTGKVTASDGNSCWSHINVEDKLAPVIMCRDTVLACFDTTAVTPIAIDACGTATVELTGRDIRTLPCDMNHIKEHCYYYRAVDNYGNISAACKQTVRFSRIDLDNIVMPNSFTLSSMTNLSCSDVTFDDDGFPSVGSTGTPTFQGQALYPSDGAYCNIGVTKEDFLIADIGCTKKYMRTWTVYEWWCNTTIDTVYAQKIEITDREAPVVTPPNNQTVAAGPQPSCQASVTIPLPTVSDDCGSVLEIDISYDGGFLNNVTTPQNVILPAGENIIRYLVYDNCENLVDTFYTVTVVDSSNPTAVCDDRVVVSLRSDGTAKAWSDTFDEGSFDNCGDIYKTLIKRFDNNCGFQIPEFKDMKYLGHRDSTRFYYLSEWKVSGSAATAFASGFGGTLLTLESANEAVWVHEQVSQHIIDPYYIGLSDIGHDGTFLWPDHVTPSYTNWAAGQPLNVGDYVVANADGEWQVANGTARHYYVYETADPYGYSDAVSFCCADAGQEIMVGFRVIDEFGSVSGDCMVRVEVQDKVPPVIACPNDLTLDCSANIDMDNLHTYGTSTASDVCAITIDSSFVTSVNSCGVGNIVRTWSASDANGTVSCTQTISLLSSAALTSSMIDWPEDYETNDGCGSNLDPSVTGRPDISGAACTDLVILPHTDETFRFSNDSDGCLKILREWIVKDVCMEDVMGYTPDTFYQAIKVNDFDPPVIGTGCDDVTINTASCDLTSVNVSVAATDACTVNGEITSRITYDEFVDNNIEATQSYNNNRVNFMQDMPLGVHNVILEFFDGCGNTASCSKRIRIVNTAPPVPLCVSGLSIPLQEMDLDGNGSIDTIMAMITADMLNADNSSLGQSGSFHPCNYKVDLSLSSDINDTERRFGCSDQGMNTVALVVTAANGVQSVCNTIVEIKDEDDFCPAINNAIIFEACEDYEIYVLPCENFLDFNIFAESPTCNNSFDLTYEFVVDFNSDGTIDDVGSGFGNFLHYFTDVAGLGPHTITASFSDQCGNTSVCNKTVTVTVDDFIRTEPICQDRAFVTISNGAGELPIDQVVNPIYFSCDVFGDFGFSPDLSVKLLEFDCDDLPEDTITVYGLNIDGVIESCIAIVDLFESDNSCSGGGGNLEILNCIDYSFQVPPCEEFVEFYVEGFSPDCPVPEDLTYSYEVDFLTDGIIDTSGTGFGVGFSLFEQYAGVGDHTLSIIFTDACGNTESCTSVVTTEIDTFLLPPYSTTCAPSLSLRLVNGTYELQIEELVDPLLNECDIRSSFGFNSDLSQKTIDITCDDLPFVDVNVFGSLPNGINIECTVRVDVFDFDEDCGNEFFAFTYGCETETIPVYACDIHDRKELSFGATSSCDHPGGDVEQYTLEIDWDKDGTVETYTSHEGDFFYPINYALGNHSAIITAFDFCGNSIQCVKNFTIEAVELDPGFCFDREFSYLNQNGENQISLRDLLYEENCSASFSPLVSITSLDIDCSTGERSFVNVYLTDVYPDGTDTTCIVEIIIENFDEICGSNAPQIISGNIATEANSPIPDVGIELEGSPFDIEYTETDGAYAFPSMPTGGTYRVNPIKDDHPLNGVSTLDLVHIQNHIIGKKILDSPYKMIAADIDNSGSITATDLLELRKLILGKVEDFSHNTSWRMVDAVYRFSDPENPFSRSFPENYMIQSFDEAMRIDFVGIKTGDVNNTVETALSDTPIEGRTSDVIAMSIVDQALDYGHAYTVRMDLSQWAGADGFQYSLQVDESGLGMIDVSSNLPSFGENNYHLISDNSVLNVSWNGEKIEQDNYIEVAFISKKEGKLSDLIGMDETITAEVYKDERIYDVALLFDQGSGLASAVTLYQNEPNPWTEYTDVHYLLDKEQEVEIVFYDMNGRLLYKEIKTGSKGLNTTRVDHTQLNSSGIIYYELITENERLREKMLLIKR